MTVIIFLVLNDQCPACESFKKLKIDKSIQDCVNSITNGKSIKNITNKPSINEKENCGKRNVQFNTISLSSDGTVDEKHIKHEIQENKKDICDKLNKCIEQFPEIISYDVDSKTIVSTYGKKVYNGNDKHSIYVIDKNDNRNPLVKTKVLKWVCGSVYKADKFHD